MIVLQRSKIASRSGSVTVTFSAEQRESSVQWLTQGDRAGKLLCGDGITERIGIDGDQPDRDRAFGVGQSEGDRIAADLS